MREWQLWKMSVKGEMSIISREKHIRRDASTHPSDAKQSIIYGARGLKMVNTDNQDA